MNKKFLKTVAVTFALTVFTLPLTACNTGTNNNMNPQRTGIVRNGNNTQFGSPVGFPNRNDRMNNNTLLDNTGRTNINSPAPNVQVPNVQLPNVQAPNTALDNASNNNMREKSMSIKNQVKNLPQVKDANVVVLGNTALVACNPNTGTMDANALRDAVTKRVKSFDPSIKNVLVTDSPDMMANINKMINNMSNRPMNEITQDFNQLVRQIAPVTH